MKYKLDQKTPIMNQFDVGGIAAYRAALEELHLAQARRYEAERAAERAQRAVDDAARACHEELLAKMQEQNEKAA